ncbi:MAG TPA: hypothetical protein VMV81_00270 [Phycisphaerae bacterium]|nr:hypothetical protein [Phycisphaerae bacterium]
MKTKLIGLTAAFLSVGFLSNAVWAWDEEGHIIVTRLAHQKLPERMPEWVRSSQVVERLAYLSGEPDRWRGQKNVDLDHTNNPDHYFDAEDLTDFGLTLKTLPPLEREFTDLLATARAQHPDRFKPYDKQADHDYTRLVPGLLPYHIAELQWKLASSWTTLKTYETNRSLCSDGMIDNARQNIIYEMGILSHFVGDGSQPLHMTKHHHGWVGENPKGYTTDKKFHSEIDGGVIALHHIDAASLAGRAKSPRAVSKEHYFSDICDYLGETLAQVEPLYELEHSGELHKAGGKKFIEDRLIEGGSMLAGVWATAYDSAVIDEFRVKQLQRNGKKHEALGDSR